MSVILSAGHSVWPLELSSRCPVHILRILESVVSAVSVVMHDSFYMILVRCLYQWLAFVLEFHCVCAL